VQLELARERRGLVRDAFHHAAVAEQRVRAVVDERVAGLVEARRERALRQRHADGIRRALAERPGGRLDALRLEVLRVPGSLAVPLAEGLEVLERHA
jgi:6,7-dimethyl-8-ribityllumazine synthase